MTPPTPDVPLDGQVVLLTGVSQPGQVGAAVARAFAERGAHVLLVDRSGESAARAGELRAAGLRASAERCDLTDAAALARLAATVQETHGALDTLVHLAGGFALSGPVAESDPGVWERMLAINLTTAYLTSCALLPLLRARRGSIIFFASEAALPGAKVAGKAAYAVAKSGLVTLMRAIAQEERTHGVRANALAPGSIRTDTNVAAMGEGVRYIERDEIASTVLFLASPAAAAITGQVLGM